jgi:transglutaminase-like putative cysteine protease
MAQLMAEAARILGFGSRVVSGYLYDPSLTRIGSSNRGSTHAWTEVYVPGAGWIAFDPTNRSVGGHNLVPTATARDIQQVMPVTGNYFGTSNTEMSVDVKVLEEA